MNKANAILALVVASILFGSINLPKAAAQAAISGQSITFDSFTASYHLSRDSAGHSLLTTEEVIKADFPSTGSWGITRSIPRAYQGHSVEVKILSITDAQDNDVPYKISNASGGNLLLTIGDPDITVYGFQTYKITYQTKDVINLNAQNDQFLLDVNGRGWSQPFGSVASVLYLPKAVASDLTSKPSCYIGYLNTTSADCTADVQNQSSQIVITVKSNGPVGPNHGLVMKLEFKPAAFSHNPSQLSAKWIALAVIGALAALASVYWYSRRA